MVTYSSKTKKANENKLLPPRAKTTVEANSTHAESFGRKAGVRFWRRKGALESSHVDGNLDSHVYAQGRMRTQKG